MLSTDDKMASYVRILHSVVADPPAPPRTEEQRNATTSRVFEMLLNITPSVLSTVAGGSGARRLVARATLRCRRGCPLSRPI